MKRNLICSLIFPNSPTPQSSCFPHQNQTGRSQPWLVLGRWLDWNGLLELEVDHFIRIKAGTVINRCQYQWLKMIIWLFSYILGYNVRILGIWKLIKLLWRIPPEKLSSVYKWKFDLSEMSVQNTLWQREFFLWGCCIVIYSPKSACSEWSSCGWCLDVVRIDPFFTSVWPVDYLLQQPFSSSDLVTVA